MESITIHDVHPLDEDLLTELDAFRVGMMSTTSHAGIRSRPMMLGRRTGATLWFPVHLDDEVVEQVRLHDACSVTFQGTLTFISVSGTATIERNRAMVQETWSDAWAAFFPGGVDDPDIAMARVSVLEGRVWDLRGARGVSAALRMVGSAVRRGLDQRLPPPDPQDL